MARGHRSAELRSIALHRIVADRLAEDPALLERARARVDGWRRTGEIPAVWTDRWGELLAGPLGELREALVTDTEEMRDLRQVTPFAGVVSPAERWRIVREVR